MLKKLKKLLSIAVATISIVALLWLIIEPHTFVTEYDNEEYTSMKCGNSTIHFPKTGVYWKSCNKPILLYSLPSH
jgi:uncharacterized integral membrane protein